MKKVFVLGVAMALTMILSMGCSSSENDLPFSIPEAGDQNARKYQDLVGTIRYDKELKLWYIYFFYPGSIDAVDAFIPSPSELPDELKQEDLRVVFSGSAYQVKIDREVLFGGWKDYYIKLDKIKKYDPEDSKANTSVIGCKNQGAATRSESDADEYIECEYMAGDYLYLKHVNAVFNCAPVELYAIAEVHDTDIFVCEIENGPKADCLCLFDLGCKVGPLQNGKEYTVYINKDTWNYGFFTITFSKDIKEKKTLSHY